MHFTNAKHLCTHGLFSSASPSLSDFQKIFSAGRIYTQQWPSVTKLHPLLSWLGILSMENSGHFPWRKPSATVYATDIKGNPQVKAHISLKMEKKKKSNFFPIYWHCMIEPSIIKQEKYFFPPSNWSWGHSHVGPLFTTEEQKR